MRACVLRAFVLLSLCGCSVFDRSLTDEHGHAQAQADAAVRGSGTPNGSATAGSPAAPFDAGVHPAAPDAGARANAGSRAPLSDAAMAPCVPATVTDYCSQLPSLLTEPVIDGALDCGPTLQELTPTGWNGSRPIPSGHHSALAVAADRDGLYFYVEVHGRAPIPHPSGSAIHCGDAVELYVDADGAFDPDGHYSSPGTIQMVIAAPAASAPGTIEALRFSEGHDKGSWSGGHVATASLPDGYAVEGYVDAASMGLAAWSLGSAIGVDVAIDVAGDPGADDEDAATSGLRCGAQLGQYFLRTNENAADACGGEPWCDSRAFCAPTLAQ